MQIMPDVNHLTLNNQEYRIERYKFSKAKKITAFAVAVLISCTFSALAALSGIGSFSLSSDPHFKSKEWVLHASLAIISALLAITIGVVMDEQVISPTETIQNFDTSSTASSVEMDL
jgi:hypothetical protein